MDHTPIFVYNRRLTSVFELLGSRENNITYSLGWALAHSPSFRSRFGSAVGAPRDAFDEVRLQELGNDGGYTDIELKGDRAHAIVEAKRGWWLPQEVQFQRYRPRFEESARPLRRFVAMSDCSSTYAAASGMPTAIDGVPVYYFGWRDIENLTREATSHAEKRLLNDLRVYLRTVATMQNPKSNIVYVVSLNRNPARPGSTMTYVDVVTQRQQYFHPVGNGYPKEPPNYIAFRYDGQLQTIHHIDSFVVSTNVARDVIGCEGADDTSPLFVYELGPPIRPPHTVKNGPSIIRNARVEVMLDLLLTSSTLTEAWEETRSRLASTSGGQLP
jgi:hypothetical protein